MARKNRSEKILRNVDEALASLPKGGRPESCATCQALPPKAWYYEKCRGIEMEVEGAIPQQKESLAELFKFDKWTVLWCPVCVSLYFYSRDYESDSGHGWELSEYLGRTDAAQIRSHAADVLKSDPRAIFAFLARPNG